MDSRVQALIEEIGMEMSNGKIESGYAYRIMESVVRLGSQLAVESDLNFMRQRHLSWEWSKERSERREADAAKARAEEVRECAKGNEA